jgi:CSLREA domain-containing protein
LPWVSLLTLVIVPLAGWPKAPLSAAAIYVVSKTADTDDGVCDADCSLREAIRAANAAAGPDTITLPAGTYTLTLAGANEDAGATGDLDITDDLTLAGAGAETTIIAASTDDRVFHIPGAFQVAISGVTIRNGNPFGSGGGILYTGSVLTLTSSQLISNTTFQVGGAINGSGFAYIVGSVIRGNSAQMGGGLYVNDDLTIISSTIQENRARDAYGGGLVGFSSNFTVTASAIVSNTAATFGGGVVSSGFMDFPVVTIVNSTISGNRAGTNGGGIHNGAGSKLTLANTTIAGNMADSDANGTGDGGGLYDQPLTGAATTARNTVLADNADLGGEADDCFSNLTSQGYNLIEDTTGCTIGGVTTGNVTGQDPLLQPLGNNGSGTLTHALVPASPAAEAGNPAAPGSGGAACEAADQRGLVRPQGDHCDIGAFELLAGVSFAPAAYSFAETAGSAVITATLFPASVVTVTAQYTPTSGTALAPGDFIAATGMLTFSPGVTTATGAIPLVNDMLSESVETFSVALGSAAGAPVVAPDTAMVSIEDDDTAGRASGTVTPLGAVLETDHGLRIEIPPLAVTETTFLVATPLTTTPPLPPNWFAGGFSVALNAERGGAPIAGFTFETPLTLTLSYDTASLGGLDPTTMVLYRWDGAEWGDIAATCAPPATYARDMADNRLSVQACQLGDIRLVGVIRLWLPLLVRN